MPEHVEDCPARYGLGRCDCDDDPPGLVDAGQDERFEEEDDFDDYYYGYADPGDAGW